MLPGGSVIIIIAGPNEENSQKASISVNVLAANSQDEVYEGTTRPRPESDKQTRKLDDEMNDVETEEKRVTPCDTKDKSQTNQKPGVLVSNSEVDQLAPKQEVSLRLRTRTRVQKETNLPQKRLATRTRITKRN